jgi:hypothetical protein
MLDILQAELVRWGCRSIAGFPTNLSPTSSTNVLKQALDILEVSKDRPKPVEKTVEITPLTPWSDEGNQRFFFIQSLASW